VVATKVMVVEDESIVAMDLKRALEGFGYQVPATATSGSQAVEIAREMHPDIVLMDIRLEGQMDGIETAHRLKESLDVPVVFLTAYSNESTLQRAKTAQPFGFLLKPFQARELRSAVEIAIYKHKMERKLRQRENWLNTILQGMADCVVATDAAGFVTYMNPPAEDLTSQTLAQVSDLTLAKALHFVDQDRVPISLELETVDQCTDRTILATLIDATGKEHPVEFSVTRQYDDKGHPEGTVVVFRDVSLRNKAAQAEASQQAEERLQALIDGGSDMIIVFDLQLKIQFASPSIEQIIGISPEEALNTRVLDHIIPEDHAVLKQAMEAVRQGKHERVTREYRVRHRDGSLVILETVSTDLHNHPLINGIVVNARDVTERKHIEAALRQSEQDYRGLFENANDSIVIFDPDGERVLEANARACEMYGVEHSELIGMSLEQFTEDIERGRKHVDLTLETDAVHRFETVQRRSDGLPLNLEITATVVNYQDNPAIYSIGRDITERRRAEQALLRANRRLETLNTMWRDIAALRSPREVVEAALVKLIDLLPCDYASVVLADPQRGESTVFVSFGDEQLGPKAGVKLPLVVRDKCNLTVERGSNHCPDLSADRSGCVMTRDQFGDAAATCVCVSLRTEGVWMGELHLISSRPESFETEDLQVAREVAGVIGIALHQGRLRAELTEHEARLRALVDNLPEGVVYLDHELRVVLANPPGRKLLSAISDVGVGDVVSELLGRSVYEIIGETTDNPDHTVTIESQDHRSFELGVVDLTKVQAHIGGLILVIRELTKELETRKRLELQERLASVGQLAAGIAHDFNNMLQAISGSAQLIQATEQLPDAVIEKARGISRQGQRGAGLIRQILDFSRTSVTERQPIRLELIIKETTKMLERIISEEVHIRTKIIPGEHVVVADPAQVQQVLMNLAVNARDAMSAGGELTIRLDRAHFKPQDKRPFPQMTHGEWLRLTVSDNGTGMDSKVAPRVFEPFFTTKEPGEGTGLGLAQVYGIVKQHEGFIDLETQPGKGTSFIIYLPIVRSEIREEMHADVVLEQVGNGELVLLVEDEAPVRNVIQEMLETLGFEVVTAASGSEALQVFERFQNDLELVISDVVLSGISGIEVSSKIQKTKPHLPVVLMSGYPLGDDARAKLSEGTTDRISKPFSSEQLGQIIARVMNPN